MTQKHGAHGHPGQYHCPSGTYPADILKPNLQLDKKDTPAIWAGTVDQSVAVLHQQMIYERDIVLVIWAPAQRDGEFFGLTFCNYRIRNKSIRQ